MSNTETGFLSAVSPGPLRWSSALPVRKPASKQSMAQEFKSYPAPWNGQLILACRKCQKKLKKDDDLEALANLKKTVKRRNRKSRQELLHVINVGCMDLCPGGGVTVCAPAQDTDRLLILRSEE